MTPPRKSTAAPAGASSTTGSRQQTSRAVHELRAGLAVLQKPYSDAAALTAAKHLAAAGNSHQRSTSSFLSTHGLDSGTGSVLQLLNQYLQWFLSTTPPTTPSSTSQRSSSSSSAGPCGICSRALEDGVVECLTQIASIVAAVATSNTEAVAAALRPHLVAADSGTLSLVGRAAALAVRIIQCGFAPTKLCWAVIGIWTTAGGLIDPALTPIASSNLSSSSTNSSFDIWRQAPGMPQALPAVADMVHWWLQLLEYLRSTKSATASSIKAPSENIAAIVSVLVQQLQLLVEGAVTMQRGKADAATTTAAVANSSGGRSTAMVAIPPAEEWWSPAARAQVERFLWHALATATASLEHHNKNPLSSSRFFSQPNSVGAALVAAGADWFDPATGEGSFGGSGSSSSRDNTSKAASIKVPLPSGTGYTAQLNLGNSSRASRQAAAALLQLATAGLPQQQQVKVTTAAAWLRQFQPPPPGLEDSCDVSMGSLGNIRLGVTPSSKEAHPALEAPGYLCWPIEEEAHNPPRSSSTTPNRQSRSNSSGRSSPGTRPPTSSTMVGVNGPDPFTNPGARLQLLAAAAAARWMDSQRRMGSSGDPLHALMPSLVDGGLGPSADVNGLHALLHLLLLLVQQMQDAPLQYRNWFLNSRAGSAVLQMLGELRFREAGQSDTGDWLVPGVTAPAAAARRQQAPAKGDWQLHSALCRVVVRKLILPGLLLLPAPAAGGSAEDLSTSGSSSDAAGTSTIMLDLNKAKPVPLMVVPPSALQLPPGCTPPPGAFFLVEQLLREAPLATSLHLAISLLQGSMPLVAPSNQQEEQHMQQKKHQSSKAEEREKALAELQQLAYCSLASSVVQAIAKKPALGAEVGGQVLEVAMDLAQMLVQAALEETDAAASSSGSGDSNSSTCLKWSVAASLAAALAAGPYKVHMAVVHSSAASNADRGRTSIVPTSSAAQGGTGSACCSRAAGCTGQGIEGCGVCLLASGVFMTLRCLELGTAAPASRCLHLLAPADSWTSILEVAARQRGITLQQHLQQRLLVLASRHPVPGVCGNVLCGRLEGPSAMGAVRGPKSTLCGGCRAAWYCCEGCQRAAWAVHSVVCSKHTCPRRA